MKKIPKSKNGTSVRLLWVLFQKILAYEKKSEVKKTKRFYKISIILLGERRGEGAGIFGRSNWNIQVSFSLCKLEIFWAFSLEYFAFLYEYPPPPQKAVGFFPVLAR